MVGAPAARRIALAASGVIGVVGLVWSVGAYGGDWTITPSIGVSETFSDNATLATDDEDPNSDFITTVSPGISINGTGARGHLNLDYSLDQFFYHRNTQDDATNNRLATVGQVELWEQVFFIDGRASIAQVVDDERQVASQSVTGQNVNRTETRAFELTPYFRHHLGSWADTEARFSYGNVTTESDTIEDTTTLSEQLRVTSGRRFTQLLWGITVLNSKTANEGDEPTERERRIDTDYTYIINRHVSLLAGLGYEDIEDPTLGSQPKGVTWSAGFALQPSSRTSMRFTAGERNGGSNFDFEGSHILSARTSIQASYSESIETSQGQILENLAALRRDPVTGQLPPFIPDDAFGLSEDTFMQRRFTLSLNGSRRRNAFGGQVFWEERDFEASGIVETVYGGSVNLSRQLRHRLNGGLTFSYRATDFGTPDERTEDEINASTSLSYQVRNDIQATVSYNLTLRKVNNAPDDLLENSVTVGLTKSF